MRERIRRLQDLTVALLSAADTKQVLSIFVTTGRDALGAGSGLCWIRSHNTLELAAAAHDDLTLLTRFNEIPLSALLPVCDVVRTSQLLTFETRDALVARYPAAADAARLHGAWAVVPLTVAGTGIGAASFSFDGPHTFSDDDRDLLTAISNQTSLAFERARLHEVNQRSEAQLRHALSAARAATWTLDLRTGHLERDPGYSALLGIAKSAAPPNPLAMHPDDREVGQTAFERSIRDGVPFDPVVRLQRDDGSYRWMQVHGRLIHGADGTPIQMSGVIVDVDEMKRVSLGAEQDRRITETMHRIASTFAGELDHDRVVQRLIDELTQVIGAESGTFYPGASCDEPKGRASTLETALVTPAGETVGHLHFHHGSPGHFTDEHQRIVVSVACQAAIALDNARLYRAVREHKEALEQAVDRAQLADRRKDEFLAMLGHELRNPLAPIMTALELIDLKQITGVSKERDVIRRQVTHMSRLIDDLLDVSRITRGTIQLAKQALELSSVLTQAIEMASPLLERRMQHLEVIAPRDVVVEADPTRLAQVFQNLLTNASKYSEPKSRIEVRLTVTNEEVTISVQDEGIGIAPELQPRLFEMFAQGDRALDRAAGGLGIGLTIARSLTELHGGTIRAKSEGPGRGSTFLVTLPRSIRASVSTVGVNPIEPQRPHLPGARVLVVDDNVDAAMMLREVLSDLGHQLQVAHDGPSALEVAASFKPDIALLDIGLPVMSGYELARKLRELNGNAALRLIAVTGYGQESDRARAKEVGFDHHLIKPIALDALLAVLAK